MGSQGLPAEHRAMLLTGKKPSGKREGFAVVASAAAKCSKEPCRTCHDSDAFSAPRILCSDEFESLLLWHFKHERPYGRPEKAHPRHAMREKHRPKPTRLEHRLDGIA